MRLDEIPGVGRDVAQIILAELGSDMSCFPSAAHAASWAGLAPGKNKSVGKNRSGKVTPGNRHLKSALVQAAHAVSRTKDNYLTAQCDGTEYRELGGDYFDKRNKTQLQRNLVRWLEGLGVKVTLQPAPVAL